MSFVVATGLVLGVGVAAAQPAAADGSGGPQVKVMTQNLYLGSSLDEALGATDITTFLTAVAHIYSTAEFTDFPARATAIAKEIDENDPDLVALQEVSNWIVTQPAGNGLPSWDFLELLLQALADRGLHYEAVATSNNADIGPAPLVLPTRGCLNVFPVPDCTVELLDRDVILVNTQAPGLTWWGNPKSGRYRVQQTFTPPPPAAPESFDRGWASIDVKFKGRQFRFFDTHLEVADFPEVQLAQALELLGRVLLVRGPVVVAGDFNSAAPPTTPGGSNTPTYSLLTKVLTDAWTKAGVGQGVTCCQNSTLTNYPSALFERIDLVLYRGQVRAVAATTVGTEPFQLTPPLWPSDHAGVVATLQVG